MGRFDSRASLGVFRFGGRTEKAAKLEREGSLGTDCRVGC
jgi:hypothetical protein